MSRVARLLLACVLVLPFAATEAAAPPAGFQVTNRAEATYVPDGQFLPETLYSNVVSATIEAVESLLLTHDWTVNRPAGAPVALPHVITNTGNVNSTYLFQLSNLAGDGYDLSSLKLVEDSNGNGLADIGEPALPLGIASLMLSPGQSANLLVTAQVPLGVGAASALLMLSANTLGAAPVSATNTDTIRTGSLASVVLSKQSDQSGSVYPGTQVNYQLVATNVGDSPASPSPIAGPLGTPIQINGTPATVFLIRDLIPAGTRYVTSSLTTDIPAALKLYRLPSDLPFHYRTNGDDLSAIEVAVASTAFTLDPNVTTRMNFGVRVMPDTSGPISNTGDSFFNDGISPSQSISNEIVLQVPQQRIGLAKRMGAPEYEHDPITGQLLGTANMRVTFTLENLGSETVGNAQIQDVLEGSSRFGTYTASAQPGPGQYTVTAGAVVSLRNAAAATFNPAYDGTAAHADMLAAGATLPPGGAIEVHFDIRMNASGRDGMIYNSATATGELGSPVYGTVRDESVNGSVSDANGDGDPTNDKSPSPVLLSLPRIGITKTAGTPIRVPGTLAQYEIDYTLTVTNSGKSTITNVRVGDNLNCTFRMYEASPPVISWQLVSPPTAQNGRLAISPGFTGSAPCSTPPTIGGNPYLEMPRDPALLLTDGSGQLDPGLSEVIRYTVRIELDPLAGAQNRVFNNTAFAGVFDQPDTLASSIVVAGQNTATVVPIDPSGVVYDSATRQVIPGVVATLRRTSCLSGPAGPITPAELFPMPGTVYTFNADGSVSMTTASDGAYYFYLSHPPVVDNCEYQLAMTPPSGGGWVWPSATMIAEPDIAPGGPVQNQPTPPSVGEPTPYYLRFNLGPALPEVWNNHVPMDSTPRSAILMLEKTGSRQTVELGASLEYTLRFKNLTGSTRTGFTLNDHLPTGFRYLAGSSRLNGSPAPDPDGGPGDDLVFNLPALNLADGQEASLVYRAVAGVGTPLGAAVNRAQAFSGTVASNQASWKVQVDGGVFSDEAYLIGKVYLDCNQDGVQGHEEIGIPGVRLIMEDGTGVVTDVEGKYSLYGLRPITHVIKLDATTLPPGAHLEVLDNRNSRHGDSRFVDLRKGELHKADFAVDNCSVASVVKDVQQRRKALVNRPDAEGEAVSKARLDLQAATNPTLEEIRRRTATGELGLSGIKPLGSSAAPTRSKVDVFESVVPRDLNVPSNLPESPLAALPKVDLQQQILAVDNSLGFVDLRSHDTLPMPLANVRVKGRLGATLRLTVNGKQESERRVGKKARMADRQLEAWEYIGVELEPGENSLLLEELDSFGIVRGSQAITLIAPGNIGRIEIEAPQTAVADAASPVRLKVRLTDDKGVPVTARIQLTLETDRGRWQTKDLNPTEPGTQVFIQGGSGEFVIVPPNEPGDGTVTVSSGVLTREARIAYLPELRPLIGAGILEGIIDLRRKGRVSLGQNGRDAFEQTLRNLSRSSDGKRDASARAAFYFKGTIKGEYLLTAAFDSDKNANERLFRDIQPDKFYPVYGDSSTKIFDAQSTQRLYVRIDKQKSWLLYGDFTTTAEGEIRKLSQTNRSVTGLKYHHENGRVSANVFGSRDNLKQVVAEIAANGTSGPYPLNATGRLIENSEKVEILVRDRNQPSLILQVIPMARFSDYTIEPLSKQLLFSSPVASIDPNLNTRFIRVTYEVETGGPAFWMGGADAMFRLDDNIQLGASYLRDDNPDNPSTLQGATAVVKLGERSLVTAELARSDTGLSGIGKASRLELVMDSSVLKVRAQITKADSRFDNPSAGFSKGRTEGNANMTYQLTKRTALRGEAIYSKDDVTGGERKGVLATLSTRLGEDLQGEIGLRASRETTAPAQPTSVGTTPNDLLTVRGRLSSRIPGMDRAQVYVEAEQDLRESEKRMAALGGDYQLGEKTRLYGRYEFISSLGSPYALNATQEDNVAVLGIETAYLQNGRLFNEFRLRDSINGREAQAASGVRNTWTLAEGLRVGGSFERTSSFGGVAGNDATAVTGSVEYTGNQQYKFYGGLEARLADAGNSYLSTLGGSYKLEKDWSLLGRSSVSLQESSSDGSRTLLSRQQIGLAWRQVDIDRWNALGRYEFNRKLIDGGAAPSDEESHVISMHANYQPRRDLIASGRYAFKWSEETYAGMTSDYRAHLFYGRITWDVAKDWDVSAQAASMFGEAKSVKYAAGIEAGYQLVDNLWLSFGYNLGGFRDDELTGYEYLDHGVYFRVRYKFDESLFIK